MKTLALLVFFTLMISCEQTFDLNAILPATVAEDNDLPCVSIHVAEHDRLVHFKTLGNPQNPTFLILHGSVSDRKACLPLNIFSDKYYTFLWDMRSKGLLKRCTKEELPIDEMANEIEAMKVIFSPDKPITILGHSWSAFFTARYRIRYPVHVIQAIMIGSIKYLKSYNFTIFRKILYNSHQSQIKLWYLVKTQKTFFVMC